MRINNNLMAMNSLRQLGINNTATGKSLEKLSSGFRINRAGDDAAGLAISEKMRAQIRGLGQASRNAQDGISFIQTAEGALNETQSILQRMRELAVQSANDTNVAVDRAELQKEVDQLAQEITRIANNTEFNTQTLLNGGISSTGIAEVKFHIGSNQGQDISLSIGAMDAESLGVARDVKTAEISGATDVTEAEVAVTNGAAIVDGASIDVSAALVAATSAALTDGNHVVGTDLTGLTASITINIDGTDYMIDDLSGWDGSGNEAALIALLESADTVGDGSGTALSTVANITGDGSALTITSNSTGISSSVTVTYGGADAADAATLVGIADSSTAAGAAASYTVTFDDGGGTTVDVTGLAGTETSITGTGIYAGLTLTTDGAFDENLAVTVDISSDPASAATFANGAKTADAVAKAGIDVSSQTAASTAVDTINDAIETVSAERAKLGAYQNRLEHTIANLDTASENLLAAESRIRDVDMAKEMMNFTKNNILTQAAQAMLAQANQAPQGVLQLLR